MWNFVPGPPVRDIHDAGKQIRDIQGSLSAFFPRRMQVLDPDTGEQKIYMVPCMENGPGEDLGSSFFPIFSEGKVTVSSGRLAKDTGEIIDVEGADGETQIDASPGDPIYIEITIQDFNPTSARIQTGEWDDYPNPSSFEENPDVLDGFFQQTLARHFLGQIGTSSIEFPNSGNVKLFFGQQDGKVAWVTTNG